MAIYALYWEELWTKDCHGGLQNLPMPPPQAHHRGIGLFSSLVVHGSSLLGSVISECSVCMGLQFVLWLGVAGNSVFGCGVVLCVERRASWNG